MWSWCGCIPDVMIIQFWSSTRCRARGRSSRPLHPGILPGKKLSIDADLNAGMIDEQQARARRKEIQHESDFYGSMDGASKFVKGDAVAAVIVMLVNILGGFIIGVVQRNLTLLDALQSYTLLTVGAGLAIQIPALLISAASGLLVTRSASELSLGRDLMGQLSNFQVMLLGTLIIGGMGFIPGLPKIPFMLVAGVLGVAAIAIQRAQRQPEVIETAAPQALEPESPQDMLEMME